MVAKAATSSSVSPASKLRALSGRKAVDTCISDTLDAFSRSSLQELVEILEQDPQKIFPTLAFARKPLEFTAAKTAISGDEPFHHTYRKMYRIPKEVAQDVIISYLAENQMNLSTLKACEKKEDGVSRNLFYFLHNITGHSPWPKFCHDRTVFRLTFKDVHEHYSSRATKIVTRLSDGEPMIDWQRFGAYVAEPLDTYPKTHLLHISGERVSLAETGVDIADATTDWGMVENYDETKAKIRVKKSVASCLELFGREFQARVKAAWRQKEFLQKFASAAQAAINGEPESDEEGEEEEGASAPAPAQRGAAPRLKITSKRKAPSAPPAAAKRTARRT